MLDPRPLSSSPSPQSKLNQNIIRGTCHSCLCFVCSQLRNGQTSHSSTQNWICHIHPLQFNLRTNTTTCLQGPPQTPAPSHALGTLVGVTEPLGRSCAGVGDPLRLRTLFRRELRFGGSVVLGWWGGERVLGCVGLGDQRT